ncbi:acyltransferase [Alkalimarinus sediminis]|uniref:Acyltransferase n=1 Tax=Alkalimarinus sediminis TaxID=1632866 RepID=A0A9E8KNJ8_9ALTE|nr:acyltransferase [Alkalimarinus sediminis]UZW73310.1 acyltransferase [Alkalimarinus sediminis]
MFNFLPAPLIGVLCSLFLMVNTVVLCTIVYIPTIIKILIPFKFVQVACTKTIIVISELWISINSAWMKLFQRTEWDVEGLEGLSHQGWYLVTSNHQSWVDIFALQHIFNRRIPFLKFFIKKELIWVPFIGIAWWAMDFPFMKRYSKEYLKKHPEMRGKDIETTRKACEKFRYTPVSVINFAEGTRFTDQKHARQESPYTHLLKPKVGGTALVLDAMGDCISTLLDITIIYPDGRPGFWEFMCGKVKRVVIRINQVEIPVELRGRDYSQDEQHKESIIKWVDELWVKKDRIISEFNSSK